MSAAARVAVVIPCYNDGETLLEAFDSAEGQDNCEIVVVDDGSTEEATLRVFTALMARGVRVVRQENQGLAAARMTGVRNTVSPYVFPLDADDFLLPGALTSLADALDEHGEVGVVWGRYQYAGTKRHERDLGTALDAWQVTYFNDLPVGSLIRRSVLLDAGGWQLPRGYEDWDLWMSLAERQVRGMAVDAVIYAHRVHGTRMSAECVSRHDELYDLLQKRHPRLFAERQINRARSSAPRSVKTLLPFIYALSPLSLYRRAQLSVYTWRAGHGRVHAKETFVRCVQMVRRVQA